MGFREPMESCADEHVVFVASKTAWTELVTPVARCDERYHGSLQFAFEKAQKNEPLHSNCRPIISCRLLLRAVAHAMLNTWSTDKQAHRSLDGQVKRVSPPRLKPTEHNAHRKATPSVQHPYSPI